jgi:putative transcriptional regulator
VNPEQGFVLHSGEQAYESSRQIAEGVVLSSSTEALHALATPDAPRHAIVALGYAGWGPGQLEGEIEDDAWLAVQASRSILFEAPLEVRLKNAAASIGVDMRLMARSTGNA